MSSIKHLVVGDWIIYQEGYYEKRYRMKGVEVPEQTNKIIEVKKIPRRIIGLDEEDIVVLYRQEKLRINRKTKSYREATQEEIKKQRLKELYTNRGVSE